MDIFVIIWTPNRCVNISISLWMYSALVKVIIVCLVQSPKALNVLHIFHCYHPCQMDFYYIWGKSNHNEMDICKSHHIVTFGYLNCWWWCENIPSMYLHCTLILQTRSRKVIHSPLHSSRLLPLTFGGPHQHQEPLHSLKKHINRFRGHASIVTLIIKHSSRSGVPCVCPINYKIRFHVTFCNHRHVWKTIDSFQEPNSWWWKVTLAKKTYILVKPNALNLHSTMW